MALDKSTFETINPSRFTTFTFPKPLNPTSLLRIAVLDSPTQTDPPRVAAMFVPAGRESDWIFSTELGHLQLLLAAAASSPGLSRLILVGNHRPGDYSCRAGSLYRRSDENDTSSYEVSDALKLKPLFLALSPKSSFGRGIPEIPILSYEDGVVSSLVLGVFVGNVVGEMLVEDVEIGVGDGECLEREFRRRLRFKRMPNLVQTQVRLLPRLGFDSTVDFGVLVHPYLAPMVASLDLVKAHINEKIAAGHKPRALCLGVGGGALVSFLETRLGFEVLGVDEDEEVLNVAREFFGLREGEFVELFVGDAIEFLNRPALEFDVVMVDLDSRDLGTGASAPPMEFRTERALLAARSMLAADDKGILVVNVVPQSVAAYETIKREFRNVFSELYSIDAGNGENFVLIAAMSPPPPPATAPSNAENSFADKLRRVISGALVDSIRKA